MLYPVIMTPHSLLTDNIANKSFYSNVITVLQDLCKNGMIIVDKNKIIMQELFSIIMFWPIKYRKKGEELLEKLDKNNRFKVHELYSISERCSKESCKHCIGLSKAIVPHILFVNEDCLVCAKEQIPDSIEIAEIPDYSITEFNRKRNLLPINLLDNEWNQIIFEENILIPLFKYSKRVRIFDRQLGHSIQNNIKDNRRINGFYLPENFKLTLEWIIKSFKQHCIYNEHSIFEIYTGIDCRFNNEDIQRKSAEELCRFETNLKKINNVLIKIKKETHEQQMPHQRFLFTDQVGVQIDRGFDILWDDGKMRKNGLDPLGDPRPIRNVSLSYCQDRGQIELSVRILADL